MGCTRSSATCACSARRLASARSRLPAAISWSASCRFVASCGAFGARPLDLFAGLRRVLGFVFGSRADPFARDRDPPPCSDPSRSLGLRSRSRCRARSRSRSRSRSDRPTDPDPDPDPAVSRPRSRFRSVPDPVPDPISFAASLPIAARRISAIADPTCSPVSQPSRRSHDLSCAALRWIKYPAIAAAPPTRIIAMTTPRQNRDGSARAASVVAVDRRASSARRRPRHRLVDASLSTTTGPPLPAITSSIARRELDRRLIAIGSATSPSPCRSTLATLAARRRRPDAIGEPRDRRRAVHAEQLQRVLGMKRSIADDHLVQHDADRVDVGPRVDRPAGTVCSGAM